MMQHDGDHERRYKEAFAHYLMLYKKVNWRTRRSPSKPAGNLANGFDAVMDPMAARSNGSVPELALSWTSWTVPFSVIVKVITTRPFLPSRAISGIKLYQL